MNHDPQMGLSKILHADERKFRHGHNERRRESRQKEGVSQSRKGKGPQNTDEEIMTRRKLHYRHPNGAFDEPWCKPDENDRLCTTRTHEVECVKCRALIKADLPRQKEFRKVQKEMWANVFAKAWWRKENWTAINRPK